MHKSKLAGFIIDCRTDDLSGAAEFWGAALGMPVRRAPPGRLDLACPSHLTLHLSNNRPDPGAVQQRLRLLW
jgi:hypothetical protein